ncbi:hypothetical protein N656DRAFT_783168 [Canariomyces notabilis]|uniref:Uncharacterized protein n=1 Tax=Canariomyces notabilis TaxID=2074819 RepID=A0AAN6QGL9_9PEZI|nr:hypothetical protein N656DRAFT_783168 [Canariomyces arenarius]
MFTAAESHVEPLPKALQPSRAPLLGVGSQTCMLGLHRNFLPTPTYLPRVPTYLPTYR